MIITMKYPNEPKVTWVDLVAFVVMCVLLGIGLAWAY